ncbi:hypothetical protein EHS25_009667 [Saitozyma podzolica]|uniref:Dienelactone hydrolase domain-containing protein n=1 Tax=Saitozyma podzolica TaxID=1890683 RepID=A0A427YJU7_9TREE|nr:hypothetical protein EHS25_009667 [Saitozyma podzolica]
MASDTTQCCPPQTKPSKPNVPHPPAESTGYELKGRYEAVGSYDKVYTVGPEGAKHALVVVYDIFGFWETTLRGQDILATNLGTTKIYVPDVFRGHPFPKDRDGDKDELKKFFGGTAKLDDRLPEVVEFAKGLKNEFETVSLMGYCWGGKLALMALASDKVFCCGAVVHPAMIAGEDGDDLSVPLGFYPSMDEPKDVVRRIHEAMQGKPFREKCGYHLYDTVHHGWAAARADLKDPENKKQYEDVYRRLGEYFACAKSK